MAASFFLADIAEGYAMATVTTEDYKARQAKDPFALDHLVLAASVSSIALSCGLSIDSGLGFRLSVLVGLALCVVVLVVQRHHWLTRQMLHLGEGRTLRPSRAPRFSPWVRKTAARHAARDTERLTVIRILDQVRATEELDRAVRRADLRLLCVSARPRREVVGQTSSRRVARADDVARMAVVSGIWSGKDLHAWETAVLMREELLAGRYHRDASEIRATATDLELSINRLEPASPVRSTRRPSLRRAGDRRTPLTVIRGG